MELSDQPHVSAALTSGKNPSTHSVTRLGGPQCLSGRFEEQKNVLSLPEFETRTVQPVPVIMSINQYCTCIDDSRFTLRAANRQVNSGHILPHYVPKEDSKRAPDHPKLCAYPTLRERKLTSVLFKRVLSHLLW